MLLTRSTLTVILNVMTAPIVLTVTLVEPFLNGDSRFLGEKTDMRTGPDAATSVT